MTNKEIIKLLKELEEKIDNMADRRDFTEDIILPAVFVSALIVAVIIRYLMN